MKTLSQIIDAVQAGEKPDYDDLRYTVVALSFLRTRDFMAIMDLAKAKRENKKPFMKWDPEWVAEERFKVFKAAMAMPPIQYVGDSHDPDNPECQKFRAMSLNLIKRVESHPKKPS